jgi:Spy/CpxP family protein refolding chaperone
MRNAIIAAAAALALAVAAAPSFAASQSPGHANEGSSANAGQNCADVLADQSGHSRSEVEYCRSQL